MGTSRRASDPGVKVVGPANGSLRVGQIGGLASVIPRTLLLGALLPLVACASFDPLPYDDAPIAIPERETVEGFVYTNRDCGD
jgi:hypothetical protein